MRDIKSLFKIFHCFKNRRAVLNHVKRPKQLTLTVLLLFLIFSIMLAAPLIIVTETTSSTPNKKAIMVEGRNNNGAGTMIWNKTYGGTSDDWSKCIEKTSDGGYIITGTTESFGAGYRDVWLIKIDANGEEMWNKTYGETEFDEGYCVAQTSDEGYIITGHTWSFGAKNKDFLLIKTDANGNLAWTKTYGNYSEEEGYSVVQTSDGGYIIAGITKTWDSERWYGDVWLIKTDENGNEEWNQTFDGIDYDEGYCVKQTSDGGYIIVGKTGLYGEGNDNVWLIKTDENGDLVWTKTYGGEIYDEGDYVMQTSDGGYIIVGRTYSYGAGQDDIWLIKTDVNGSKVWDKTFGGMSFDRASYFEQAADEGYIIAGYTESYGAGGRDVWLIKVYVVPVIDHPPDTLYEEASWGHSITWHPSDDNPSHYTVTRNNIVLNSTSWEGGSITINVGRLSVGTYIFTCTVNDTAGNSASDSVTVTVIPTSNGGDDNHLTLVILMLGVGVVAGFLFMRSKIPPTSGPIRGAEGYSNGFEEELLLPLVIGREASAKSKKLAYMDEISKFILEESRNKVIVFSDLAAQLDISAKVIRNRIRQLVRNGVISGVLTKDVFVGTEFGTRKIQTLLEVYKKISFNTLLEEFKLSDEKQLRALLLMIGLQRFMQLQVNDADKTVSLPKEISKVEAEKAALVPERLCPFCGSEIMEDDTSCENCGVEFHKCVVCNLPILNLDALTKTPCCKTYAHRGHLKEWLKIKGKCPNCGEKLEEWEIT